MINETLAYMAGLVDGEGCIGLLVARKNPTSKVFNYKVRLTVSNNSIKIMDWLVDNFGGRVFEKKTYSPKHNKGYLWQVNCSQAGKVLSAIRPYLVIKKKQADLACAYRMLQENSVRTFVGEFKFPVGIREEIYDCFKFLNRRGPVTTNTPDVDGLITKIESELKSNLERHSGDTVSALK